MTKSIIFRLTAVVYGVALIYVVFLLPRRKTFDAYRAKINLVPFRNKWEVYGVVRNTNSKYLLDWQTEFYGNLILLFPLPFALYFINKQNYSFSRWSIWVVLTSLCIEIVQFVFNIGVADIDDVILNSVGGFIGLVLVHFLQKKNSFKL